MGYPVRWEEIAVTPLREETPAMEKVRSHPAIHLWALVVAAVMGLTALALTVLGTMTFLQRAQQPPALRSESSLPGAHVALGSSTATRRVGFVEVSGEVINRTNAPLKNLEAVVELLDSKQHTVKTESSLVSLDPLPAGRTAPFQVEMMDDNHAIGYRIHFKRLMGAPLD